MYAYHRRTNEHARDIIGSRTGRGAHISVTVTLALTSSRHLDWLGAKTLGLIYGRDSYSNRELQQKWPNMHQSPPQLCTISKPDIIPFPPPPQWNYPYMRCAHDDIEFRTKFITKLDEWADTHYTGFARITDLHTDPTPLWNQAHQVRPYAYGRRRGKRREEAIGIIYNIKARCVRSYKSHINIFRDAAGAFTSVKHNAVRKSFAKLSPAADTQFIHRLQTQAQITVRQRATWRIKKAHCKGIA